MPTNDEITNYYNEIKATTYRGAIIRHINSHFNIHLSSQQVYDIIHNITETPRCRTCGRPLKYKDWTHGYQTYCSLKCSNNDPEVQRRCHETKCQNGTSNNWQRGHQKFLEENHITNCSQLKDVKIKKYKTKLKKFGDGRYNNRIKFHQTMNERYGVDNALENRTINEKRHQTNLQRYGVAEYPQTAGFVDKVHQTKLERYGNPNYSNREQALATIAFNHNILGKTTLRAEKRWLKENHIPKNDKCIPLGETWCVPDGLDEEHKIVYEFLGDFWHGNPAVYNPQDINPRTHTTFQTLYEQTLQRFDALKQLGYKIVYIWYTDFKKFGISKNQEY